MPASILGNGWVAAGLLVVGGVVTAIVRQISPWRKLSIDSEKIFRDDLIKRVEKLEAEIEFERKSRAAEVSLLRHRVANAEHALDLFIALIEAQPERAAHHAARIKEHREKDRDRLSAESATIRAAEMTAAKVFLEEPPQ